MAISHLTSLRLALKRGKSFELSLRYLTLKYLICSPTMPKVKYLKVLYRLMIIRLTTLVVSFL